MRTEYEDDEDETLLTYSVNTFPRPIQVSPPTASNNGNASESAEADDAVSKAAITIVVSNNDRYDDICCKSLRFEFETGEGATELTTDPESITPISSTGNWQISNNKDGSFSANPKTDADRLITEEGLAFELKNIKVNRSVGTFTLTIIEESQPQEGEEPCGDTGYEEREKEINLAKFPFGFYAGNFRPEYPMVKNKERINLLWDGSALAEYWIAYDDQDPIDISNKRKWKSRPLHNTTTFILKAIAKIDEDLEIEDPPTLYFSTTVIVANPEFLATSTAISDNTDLEALKATAKSTLYAENKTKDSSEYAAEFINDSKNVGAMHVKNKGNFRAALIESTSGNASTLRAVNSSTSGSDGRASYLESRSKDASTLWVQNKSTSGGHGAWINNASKASALVVKNDKGGYALDVRGDALMSGEVFVEGTFSGLKEQQPIDPTTLKTYYATTDGFICMYLSPNYSQSYRSGWIAVMLYDKSINSFNPYVSATLEGASATAVIKKGDRVWFNTSLYNVYHKVYFRPLGKGKLEEEKNLSKQQIQELEASAGEQTQAVHAQFDERRHQFLDALEKVLDQPISEEKRTTLNEALKTLIGG